jgi:hypothetical protein
VQTGTDRERQDQIIRYLSDARLRSVEDLQEFLDPDEASRARRFSRFLARRYYRDRLTRGFRYSARLGHEIAPIVDAVEFDSILDTCALGSFATATKVGDLACSHLVRLRAESWWRELLEYDKAFFLQLATLQATPPGDFPRRNASAILRNFQFPISELLARVGSDKQVGDDLQGKATLLFSRTAHGKIYVAEVDETTSRVFGITDGTKSSGEIAGICGLNREEVVRILTTLSEIGSVVLPIGHVVG